MWRLLHEQSCLLLKVYASAAGSTSHLATSWSTTTPCQFSFAHSRALEDQGYIPLAPSSLRLSGSVGSLHKQLAQVISIIPKDTSGGKKRLAPKLLAITHTDLQLQKTLEWDCLTWVRRSIVQNYNTLIMYFDCNQIWDFFTTARRYEIIAKLLRGTISRQIKFACNK